MKVKSLSILSLLRGLKVANSTQQVITQVIGIIMFRRTFESPDSNLPG
ncbi:hypothetical protein [Arcticibacter pallidicorallinus]|nr:hypothetical protein [Arcticibacter pallidicorallinus]